MNEYISYYDTSHSTKEDKRTTVRAFMKGVIKGEWIEIVEKARSLNGERLSKFKRAQVPAVTLSGTFKPGRTDDKLEFHSGYICIDVDSPKSLNKYKQLLMKDPFVCGYFTSISGKGLAIVFKIRKPSQHRLAYDLITEYIAEKYNLEADPACKNVSRIRFVSYDPAGYWAPGKKDFFKVTERTEAEIVETEFDIKEVEELVDKAVKRKVDLMEGYHMWYRIGQALAVFGEAGRPLFHKLSAVNKHEYDKRQADKQYDNCLAQEANGTRDVRIGPGTIYYVAKQHGILLNPGPTYVSTKNNH